MITENLSSKQYMLKYGINIEVGHVYKNFLEVLEAVGLPVELSQSKSSKSRIIDSLKEHTVYRRSGQKWVFQENNYGKIKEFPELEEGEILLPYDDQEVYYVSSFGRIWNRKNCEWISKYEYNGRYKVSLYSHPHILSRVVALTFIPNPDNKQEVNHKDENPKNDRVDNLEWMTRKENNNYGTRIQRASETRAKNHPNSGFNKGMPVSDEIKQKRAQTIKERCPEGWGSWNKGRKRKPALESKQKAIQKIKSLIIQYNISFEDIYPPSDI